MAPRRFKNESKPPEIEFKGVENGKYYNHGVTLIVKGDDDIEGPTYAYGLYKGKKFKTKTFTEDGEYEISAKAIDWAKNEKDEKITFYIDLTSPETTLIQYPEGGICIPGGVERVGVGLDGRAKRIHLHPHHYPDHHPPSPLLL
jgi:hypothetical protein